MTSRRRGGLGSALPPLAARPATSTRETCHPYAPDLPPLGAKPATPARQTCHPCAPDLPPLRARPATSGRLTCHLCARDLPPQGASRVGGEALARDHENRRAAARLVATQGRRVASRLEALPRRVRRTFLGPVGPCRSAGHEKAPSGHAKSPAMRAKRKRRENGGLTLNSPTPPLSE